MSFSPDGTLASGGDDRTVKLWDVATRQTIATLTHEGPVLFVSFSPDGETLAYGGWGEIQIKLWDVATQQTIATLTHGDVVSSVSFSPDGETLASGEWDSTVKLWDVATRVSFATLPNTDVVYSVSFSPDGTTLASGTAAGTVDLWDTSGLMGARLEAVVEIDIPDPNLRAAIAEAIGVPPNTPIFRAHLENLTRLEARNANISDLTGLEFAIKLKVLNLSGNNIGDVSALIPVLSGLTHLIDLNLSDNSITDLSPLAVLTNLRTLDLGNNSISDFSPLTGLTNLTQLFIWDNNISDLSPVAGLTNLTWLTLSQNSISDLSSVAGLTNLRYLNLRNNSISDISSVAGLTNLTSLYLRNNNISDISAVAGLTNLTWLTLSQNSISDLSSVVGLTNLRYLQLRNNSISDISSVVGLTNLTELFLGENNISDISPLIANTGLGSGDTVSVWGNPLSYLSIHTHILTLQSRGVTVEFDNQAHPALLKISGDNQKGASFTPLSQPFVVEVQDENGSALTGISVRFAITTGGGTLSTTITRTNENGRAESTLTLGPNLGTNTVEVSAAGIEGRIIFNAISDTESPPITTDINGDGSVNILDLILIASELGNEGTNLAADVSGDGVVNILDLILVAGMFDEVAAAPSAQPQVPETLTAVDVQHWLTDAISLEVRDLIIKRGIMVLGQLLVSLTPTETKLLANYPNPFNPETWIPYRLAEDAFVTLTIYDGSGRVVRTLDVGHRIASAYESRSKAVYWDGKNEFGERVASGVYFYTLMAGDYSATRRMVILK